MFIFPKIAAKSLRGWTPLAPQSQLPALQHRAASNKMMATTRAEKLSPNTRNILKSTIPVLEDHGDNITTTMYKKMLGENPTINELFNPAHQVAYPGCPYAQQPIALANSFCEFAKNIDNLDEMSDSLELIAQKHVGHHILPEHYPIVGEHFLWAVQEVLKDAATPTILNAWGEGYQVFADIFIQRETQLREELAAAKGGWSGWREFVVDAKVVESSECVSVYFKPADDKPILDFIPGQYTTVRMETPTMTTQRNYSLSNAPNGKFYRITVKREDARVEGAPVGIVSNWLHEDVREGDIVKLAVPVGNYVLELDTDKPIVLLSGGIGITPAVSMLEYMVEKQVKNNIVMINAVRDADVEVMHEALANYRRKNLNVVMKTIYDDGGAVDGKDLYPRGPLTMEQLDAVLWTRDCHYYFCGPPGFLKAVRNGLREWGVREEQIHFEFFGPLDDL